ncbi:MAG: urea ABC transporter permease subunit UrtB [Desulfovibrionaceae bacterium]|nr:urea ABC transporter permease subunit UrtB [Desulfovibrionaceae bacterium]MBF0513406.1 urea ABC transporter permease subunit UrtB [Desulfovibrionaceae bacterium]
MTRLTRIFLALALFCLPCLPPLALAADGDPGGDYPKAVAGLGSDSRQTILDSLDAVAGLGDPRALPALDALQDRRLKRDAAGRVLIVSKDGASAVDAASGENYPGPLDALSDPPVNNLVRQRISAVLSALALISPDPEQRLLAAKELAGRPVESARAGLAKALGKETDARVKSLLEQTLAQIDLKSPDKTARLAAIKAIGASGNSDFLPALRQVVDKLDNSDALSADPDISEAAARAVASLERRDLAVRAARDLFFGASLGSVLLLAALGLAITFGLMGVINMAHGEMLMIGAYVAYVVQEFFSNRFPDFADWYLPAAIPLAFATAAVIGMLLERAIIRHLYGRPLETLLATWGISLALIQTVRLIFGAQNVEVRNPAFLSGGFELVRGLTLTYNRIGIIVFVVFVVALTWLLLNRTPLGLSIRAVTQSRSTASAMGIFTSRVDMWTFGLGSGIAGLGGVALTQVGNVGPELGQSYIVDSFMVVVLGGVGKLAGTIFGALGLGFINKFLEPFSGAVLGKIIVLVLVVVFIQKRPQGIFALKGRTAD